MTLDFGAERAATFFPKRPTLPRETLIANLATANERFIKAKSRMSEPVCRNVQAFVGVRLCTRGSELPLRAGARRPPRELADRPETSAPSCLLPPVLLLIIIGDPAQLGSASSFDDRSRARLLVFLAHFAAQAARHVIC